MYENKYRNGQVSEYDKKRYEENKDYYREQYKKWCKNNPDYFEKHYEENKDRILESRKEYNKKYYEENKEKIAQYGRMYYEKNIEAYFCVIKGIELF